MDDTVLSPALERLTRHSPFADLPAAEMGTLAADLREVQVAAGELVFEEGKPLDGLYIIETGAVEIWAGEHSVVSHRGPGEIMGERGLLRDGRAVLSARASEPTVLLLIPAPRFLHLLDAVPAVADWFEHARPVGEDGGDTGQGPYAAGLMAIEVQAIMSDSPITCAPGDTIQSLARTMRDRRISSVLVMDGHALRGIVTVHDLVNKVLAEGKGSDLHAESVMTRDPVTILPTALGLDALLEMSERRISHLPVADATGRIVGMVGRTDLFRQQATTASHMSAEIVSAPDSAAMAEVMTRLPELLSNLVNAGIKPQAISRRITDLTDAITRRLLSLAEAELGPAPARYVWAACGSQGRREQTGVSDQDNCLIIDGVCTDEHAVYFDDLARFVSDGLNDVGFIYCPGDMMATNPRWRQPREVWSGYFDKWIAQPDEEAQMLASVMFDLRAIAGDPAILEDMRAEVLDKARKNSIFVRFMVSNSLKHGVPISLFGGLSVIRSGAHKNSLDLKMAGVVPVVDLGRVYALKGGIAAVGTRDRIEAAIAQGVISDSGGRDLLAAYDLICEVRLRHQAAQIGRGQKPDNFVDPNILPELERNHLRDAFLVVKTMQASLGRQV